jgi:Holliday junction resolvasome RuvABC endonuclease subunit
MASIGIRVTPSEIYYSIVDIEDDGFKIISISHIKVPKALDIPCKLSYVRNTFNTLIKQYKITRAGIKLIEGNARPKVNLATFLRLNLEGIFLELFANSSVEKYLLGVASNISAILEIKSKPVKEMASDLGIEETDLTDEGKKLNDNNKESLVVAVAALF